MTLLRLNDAAISWREVDGEIIALQHTSSEYLSTNGTGALLWKSLAEGASREDLIGLIVSEFGIDQSRAARGHRCVPRRPQRARAPRGVSQLGRSGNDENGPTTAAPAAKTGASTVFDYRPPDDRLTQIRRIPGAYVARPSARVESRPEAPHGDRSAPGRLGGSNRGPAPRHEAASQRTRRPRQRRIGERALSVARSTRSSSPPCSSVVAAFTAYEQKLLVELASRHAFDRIIEVSVAVDFEAFEDAEFYDQLQRARNSGLFRLIDMVNSVTALTTGVLTSISIAVVLFVLEPILLVFVALAAVFPLLATVLNSRAAYSFEHGLTADGPRAPVPDGAAHRARAREGDPHLRGRRIPAPAVHGVDRRQASSAPLVPPRPPEGRTAREHGRPSRHDRRPRAL